MFEFKSRGCCWLMIDFIVITDPMDSKFDLEAYLTMKMADESK